MSLRAATIPLLLAACGLRPYDFGASATGTTTTGSSSTTTDGTSSTDAGSSIGPDTGVTTTGPASTGDRPTTGDDTSGPFMPPPDGGVDTKECDHWMQDCPEGQKCMPYSGDDDPSWDGWKCVDIVPDPDGLYEDCMVFGSAVSGEDTCDNDLMCWDVDSDTGIGHCFGLCIGSVDTPHCADPTAYCVIASRGVLAICFPWCDPILQDCSATEVCISHPQFSGFFCVLDASGDEGQVFDVCEYPNGCDPGLLCVDPTAAAECDPMAPGCCLPFCDTSLPNTCPGAGQECLPWYGQGEAAPGYENVGSCGLLMP